MYPLVQLMKPGDYLLGDEAQLDDCIQILHREKRITRVQTFRHIQACSHMIFASTEGLLDYDSLMMPSRIHARPVGENEARVVEEDGGRFVAKIINSRTGEAKVVFPSDISDLNMLIKSWDEGPTCTAADAFERHFGVVPRTVYDRLRRMVRDLKLSDKDAAGGVHLRAKIFST